MRPLHLSALIIFFSLLAGSIVYVAYPLESDVSYGVVQASSGSTAADLPGFAVGAAGVGASWVPVRLEGVVVGHGFAEAGDVRVPFMRVEAEGRVYTVLIGGRVAGELAESAGVRIVEMPMAMMGHRVVVDGLLLEGTDIVVARGIAMAPGPGPMGPMHGMPMHGGPGR